MNKAEIKKLFCDVANGSITPDEAVLMLKTEPFRDMEFAKPDFHRGLRQGRGEVIYGEGKTAYQTAEIAKALIKNGQKRVLITRLSAENALIIKKETELEYYENAKIGIIGGIGKADCGGEVLVITGGTSDMYAAEEAALTAEFFGSRVKKIYDVGVAGIHRLLAYCNDIMNARVIIVAAGMEGALASVVGGLADCPVIAVPTSVGYGASFGGVAALLSMLNSCASGVSVVNIDNGFGAGYIASLINHIGK